MEQSPTISGQRNELASDPIQSNYLAFYRDTTLHLPDGLLRNTDEDFIALGGIAHPIANVICRTRWGAILAPEQTARRIALTLRPFAARRLPVLWYLWPETEPHDLGRYLAAAGLTLTGQAPAMSRDLTRPLAEAETTPELDIEPVTNTAAFERWIVTCMRGFGFSPLERTLLPPLLRAMGYTAPMRQYLGWLRDQPVATATLFISEGGVAGIYNVATVPETRRKGIGAALTLAALRDAIQIGCATAILTASAAGHHLYQRLGFVDRYEVPIYAWMPSAEG